MEHEEQGHLAAPSGDVPSAYENQAPRPDQRCVECNKPFVFGPRNDERANVYTIEGKKEIAITGVCERCFDALFSDDE